MPRPDPEKPIPPPMQSVIKGGWTYRIENPTETVVSALKKLAEEVKSHSWAFVRHGPQMLLPPETAAREDQIVGLADEIEKLADRVPQGNVAYPNVEAILSRLHKLGLFPDGLIVSNVARAIHALEKQRLEIDRC
jgi:hypothetical protein